MFVFNIRYLNNAHYNIKECVQFSFYLLTWSVLVRHDWMFQSYLTKVHNTDSKKKSTALVFCWWLIYIYIYQ